jgi:hypothetical protein
VASRWAQFIKTSYGLGSEDQSSRVTQIWAGSLMSPLTCCDLGLFISMLGTLWSERPCRENAQAILSLSMLLHAH